MLFSDVPCSLLVKFQRISCPYYVGNRPFARLAGLASVDHDFAVPPTLPDLKALLPAIVDQPVDEARADFQFLRSFLDRHPAHYPGLSPSLRGGPDKDRRARITK